MLMRIQESRIACVHANEGLSCQESDRTFWKGEEEPWMGGRCPVEEGAAETDFGQRDTCQRGSFLVPAQGMVEREPTFLPWPPALFSAVSYLTWAGPRVRLVSDNRE